MKTFPPVVVIPNTKTMAVYTCLRGDLFVDMENTGVWKFLYAYFIVCSGVYTSTAWYGFLGRVCWGPRFVRKSILSMSSPEAQFGHTEPGPLAGHFFFFSVHNARIQVKNIFMFFSSSVHLYGFTIKLNINTSWVKIQLNIEFLSNKFWCFSCVC